MTTSRYTERALFTNTDPGYAETIFDKGVTFNKYCNMIQPDFITQPFKSDKRCL